MPEYPAKSLENINESGLKRRYHAVAGAFLQGSIIQLLSWSSRRSLSNACSKQASLLGSPERVVFIP